MKAYVFSIGERTTGLCCELMEKYGFDVILMQDESSLAAKLAEFYNLALETEDELWLRIDADIIPNRNVKKLLTLSDSYDAKVPYWLCASGYDWYKQDRGAISIHVMNRRIVERAETCVGEVKDADRPETAIWRRKDINPFTKIIDQFNFGIHGYGQLDQRSRIKELKHIRNQKYDWDLLDRIEKL